MGVIRETGEQTDGLAGVVPIGVILFSLSLFEGV